MKYNPDQDAFDLRAKADVIKSGRARFVVDKEAVEKLLAASRRKWKRSLTAVIKDFSKRRILSSRTQMLFEIMSDLHDILEAMSEVGRKAAKTKKQQVVTEEV